MKALVLDIETSPIVSYTWGIWEQNVGLNQINQDWAVIAWSAKWLGDPPSKILYKDQRKAANVFDDKELLKPLHALMDEADILITQNGKAFDAKKLNARFILNGMRPPSPYRHIDTCLLAKRRFGFTSNKLEYLSDKLCKKYKKLKHNTFAGFDMWKECLAGNLKAWKEMEKYNKHDVLALEELYHVMSPWQDSISLTTGLPVPTCNCGDTQLQKRGYSYTTVGKFQRYQCQGCGAWYSDKGAKNNLISKEDRQEQKKRLG